MPSEQRLHPASLLFAFAASLKAFALPGILAILSFGRASDTPRPTFGRVPLPQGWELWLMVFLVPSGLAAIARYLSFRLRYEDTELVIRSGILFRNERHIPYERIQNLEAVQNVVHRLLNVVEVRVETGAGREPEASISVLPATALPDMRRRVFAGRDGTIAGAAPTAAGGETTLLRLPLRELLLCGFLENRGLVVIGALYGLLWESGVLNGVWERIFEGEAYTPGLVRRTIRTLGTGDAPPLTQVAILLVSLTVFLLLVRALSMGWAVVRLYGFHLSRAGEDLRAEFGLMTRVSTTIPLRRVQTMTVREGPVYRLASRVSVRVETAGGQAGQRQAAAEREWVAPLIHPRELPALVREVLPGIDLAALEWQPAHVRAFRRAIKPALFWSLGIGVFLSAGDYRRATIVLPLAAVWAIVSTHKHVQHLGWAATDDIVAFRSGWLWRSVTLVRLSKIQVVTRLATPFDRRTAMARVRVDTAGAGSHRVDIPYLAHDVATALHARLAAAAASTAFRW